MKDLAIFQNEVFGQIRVAGTSEEPLFCLADVCRAIGIENARNVRSRLDEEDVRLVDTLTEGGNQKINFITEPGLYDVIIRSDSDKAKPFRKWVTSVVLPSIRKTGSYSSAAVPAPKLSEKLMWVREVKKLLNLNETSTLSLLEKLVSEPDKLPLPDYTPSKGILKSATELLKERGMDLTARDFNLQAMLKGYLCEQTRKSSNGGAKTFKAITEKGRPYGENQVSPKNPRETQPLWYADKFGELLKELGIDLKKED